MKITYQVPSTFWSSTSTSTLTFPYTKYSSTSSTDKYVLKYKYQVQVLYLTPTLCMTHHPTQSWIYLHAQHLSECVLLCNNDRSPAWWINKDYQTSIHCGRPVGRPIGRPVVRSGAGLLVDQYSLQLTLVQW